VADAAGPLASALTDYAAASDPAQLAEIIERYREQVQRLAATAEVLGLSGLQGLCTYIDINIAALEGCELDPALYELLERWPALVIGYLRAPKDGVYSRELADHCRQPGWLVPLDATEVLDLGRNLTTIAEIIDDESDRPSRPVEAQPEDVVLDIPMDVNPALVEAFLAEAPLLAGAYTSLIENVIRGGAGPDSLNEARRHVHSIKGAANTIGVRGVVQVAHHLEDLLEYLGQRSITPQGALAKLLMDAADCLEMMLESLTDNEAPPAQAQSVLQRLLDIANAIDRGEVVEAAGDESRQGRDSLAPGDALDSEGRATPGAVAGAAAEDNTDNTIEPSWPDVDTVPALSGDDSMDGGGTTPGMAEVDRVGNERSRPRRELPADAPPAAAAPSGTKPPAPAGRASVEIARAIRVAAATIDEMLRLSSEMTIGRSHIQERLHRAFSLTAELREHHGLLQSRATDLDRLVTVQGVAAGQKRGEAGVTGIFDALEMDQYSELHGAVHGFVETAADVQTLGTRVLDALAAIETAVTQQGLVNTELHEQIMRARMVPAVSIEPRLARTVRQACDATGKRARLDFQGGDVMLDDHVVNDLINPLAHLLRNAVGHGLETPQDRAALGKPEDGTLRLAFVREGNHIVIRCEDDGAGLDLHRIHGLAVQRGLIAEDADLSEAEIARLILLPGFSTSDSVSEISGRGVGMDIVHTAIRKLKGSLDIQTFAGRGCRFILRLPLTLGSAHCLLVRSAGDLVAIPTDTLDRVVYSGARNVERLGTHWVFREERESCDVHDLAELLDHAAGRTLGEPDDTRPVVVVKDADGTQAVVVDALLSGRDLVIKHLGRYLTGARGVVGASLLGDGRVLPVLDMQELLRLRRGGTSIARPQFARAQPAATARPALTNILVVDDSLSVRQALTQLLEDDGYQVTTAKDGIEALECFAREMPAAVLVDLEMPRMNGLELTQRLRGSDATRHLPVIMVTSRTSDKHRAQAQLAGVDVYLTKPYREGDLLARLRSMLSKAA
jgi:chemotaxis protein histidine kinase CheA/ActR/RegA family two-component response regulator